MEKKKYIEIERARFGSAQLGILIVAKNICLEPNESPRSSSRFNATFDASEAQTD